MLENVGTMYCQTPEMSTLVIVVNEKEKKARALRPMEKNIQTKSCIVEFGASSDHQEDPILDLTSRGCQPPNKESNVRDMFTKRLATARKQEMRIRESKSSGATKTFQVAKVLRSFGNNTSYLSPKNPLNHQNLRMDHWRVMSWVINNGELIDRKRCYQSDRFSKEIQVGAQWKESR